MPNYGFTIVANDLVSAKMAEAGESIRVFEGQAAISTKQVTEHFDLMGERMGETFKNLKSLLLTGLGITAIFEGWELIEKSKVAFEDLEKQITKVDTVLKSTKFKAGFSSEDIQDQSKELSKSIVNQRTEILNAQAVLLSYNKIRGETFKKATTSVADYSTFFGGDMASGARVLGRALQDPLQGMNQLRRVGIVLEDQQKKRIKALEQSGHLVQAQAILLDELNKKFGGQSAAYALTDAGKIQVASKAFTELQYKIGEIVSRVEVSLIPSFIHITKYLTDAFNSSTVQFFIAHIKDLVSLVLRLIPIWITYKAVMIANSLVTEGYIVLQKLLAVSVGNTTAVIDGATISLEGFSTALASTGIGALVVGVGLLVEKLISMNSQLDALVDKKYKLGETKSEFKDFESRVASIQERATVINQLSPTAKKQLASDVSGALLEGRNKIPVWNERGQTMADSAKKLPTPTTWERISAMSPQTWGMADSLRSTEIASRTHEALNGLRGDLKNVGGTFVALKDVAQLLKKQGIKPLTYANPGSGIKGAAGNISNLSGASGGLGEAKIVHIHIGVVQQNNGVKESKEHSVEAAEYILRILNNANSQNSQ